MTPQIQATMEVIQKVAAEEADHHPSDIDKAVLATVARVKRMGHYDEFVEELATRAIRGIITDARHTRNVAMRKEMGDYGGPARVIVGEATAAVAMAVYSYRIAGTTLGMILGEQLPEIAAHEAARADGHTFNARLCQALAPKVPKGKMVSESVPEQQIKKLFERLQRQTTKEAA